MAANKSIESLYISLGLDQSQLKSDFLAADKTVAENMALLNRENNIIKLRMQVDTAGLDPVKDAEQILQTKLAAVNEMLRNQQDRVKLASANWNDLSKNLGYTAKATQQAEANMLRQKLALQQLEQELKKLNAEQQKYNQSQAKSSGKSAANLLQSGRTGISSLASNMSSAMSQIQTATASTSGALDALGTALTMIKSPAGIAVAALAAIPVVAVAASNELLKMARPAVEAGDAVYTLSRRMATSIPEASKFNTAMKLMGVDTGQILGTLERLDKQVLNAGQSGNALTHTFSQLGISLQRSDGSLKSHHEQMLELAKGLQRAKEAGVQFDFQNRLTRAGLGDLVVVLEDYQATLEDSKKLVKAGLADPQLAHEVKAQMLLLEQQQKQISTAFGNALLPVANNLAPKLQEAFGKLTSIINQNADTIKYFGEVASEILTATLNLVVKLADGLATAASSLKDMMKGPIATANDDLLAKDKTGELLHERINSFEEYRAYMEKEGKDLLSLHPEMTAAEMPEAAIEEFKKQSEALLHKQYEELQAAYKKEDERLAKVREESIKKMSEGMEREFNSFESFSKGLEQRGMDYFSLHPEIKVEERELDAQKQKAEAYAKELWDAYNAAWDKAQAEGRNRLNISEAHSDWFSKIQEEQDKLKPKNINLDDIANIAGATDNVQQALEKQISKIREWETAQVEAGKKVGASEDELAQVHEVAEERIRKAKEETTQKVQQESLKRAQEYEKEAQATQKEADMQHRINAGETITQYDKQIAKIGEWKDAAMQKAATAQEVASIEMKAAADAAKAYEEEIDRIKNLNKSLEDEIYEMTHTRMQTQLYRAQKKYQEMIKQGADKNLADQWFNLKVRDIGGFDKVRQGMEGAANAMLRSGQSLTSTLQQYGQLNSQAYSNLSQLQGNQQQLTRGLDSNVSTYLKAASQLSGGMPKLEGIQKPVYDIDGKLMKDWVQSSMENGMGKVYTNIAALDKSSSNMDDASKQLQTASTSLNTSSNNMSTGLQAINQVPQTIGNALKNMPKLEGIQKPVYDIDGKLMKDWVQSSMENGFGKVYTNIAALDKSAQGIEHAANNLNTTTAQFSMNSTHAFGQFSNSGQQISSTLQKYLAAGYKPVYDLDGKLMQNWVQSSMENGMGKVYEYIGQKANNDLETANRMVEASSQLANASKQLENAAQYQTPEKQQQDRQMDLEPLTKAVYNLANRPTASPTINVDIGTAVTPDSQAMTWLSNQVGEQCAGVMKEALNTVDNSY